VAREGEEGEGELPSAKDDKVVPLYCSEALADCSLPQLFVQNVARDVSSAESLPHFKVADDVVLFGRIELD
jgi:hypothetical protein